MASLFQKAGQPMVQNQTPQPNSQAQPLWQKLLSAAGTGADALGGDASALGKFMNPAWAQLMPMLDQMRERAGQNAQTDATLQGGGGAAFDSTRAAAMKGAEMSGVDNIMAQMKYGDTQNSLARALGLASGVMGMGMGQQTSTPTTWSPLGSLAGLAMTPFGGGTGLFGAFNSAGKSGN